MRAAVFGLRQQFSQDFFAFLGKFITFFRDRRPMANANMPAVAIAEAANAAAFDADDDNDDSIHLAAIWEADVVEREGHKFWKCLWCKSVFKGRHANKAAAHLARKNKGLLISACLC